MTLSKLYYLAALVFLSGALRAGFFDMSICEAANEIYAIRSWSSPTSTRIVLDIKERAVYHIIETHKPSVMVIDLKNFKGDLPPPPAPIHDGIVKTVNASRIHKKNTVRITITLEKPATNKIFQLDKFMDKPPRLAIDIIRPDLEKRDKIHREETRKLKEKDIRIVVIDPGHGGEDPGAIGPRNTKEKDIVLSIAKATAHLLNKQPGIRAYLTRKGDYFIPLSTRTRIAREYGADLLVSIHADSSFSRKTQGASVYCLSLEGASSNTAQAMAQKENRSDLIGGVPLDNDNDDLNAIIFDLVQTNTLNSSLRCAEMVLREIAKVNTLKWEKPQQACFKVLRDPNFASLIIETDFLSNPHKEKALKSTPYQRRLAGAIARATANYLFEVKPRTIRETPARSSPRKALPGEKTALFHTVKKGETLSSIALKYRLSVTRLQEINGLTDKNAIKAGTKLKVGNERQK